MAENGGHLEGLEMGRKKKELLVLERPAFGLMGFGEDAKDSRTSSRLLTDVSVLQTLHIYNS